ncbi:MAG TPA: hypothetical protein VHM88_10965, partial [Candidatus Acidoferrales bacterium]|nr:hypothetical protein [Candidatus Acidoferrales bacterium]
MIKREICHSRPTIWRDDLDSCSAGRKVAGIEFQPNFCATHAPAGRAVGELSSKLLWLDQVILCDAELEVAPEIFTGTASANPFPWFGFGPAQRGATQNYEHPHSYQVRLGAVIQLRL